MILNGHYYPDWIWKHKIHKNEETGEFEGDAAFCVLEGNRLGGKTVGVGVYCIQDFFKYGYKCCYVARYKDNIEDSKIQPLESFWSKAWRFVNSDRIRVPDIDAHTLTFKGHYAYIDDKLFCYPAALSVSGKTKNADFDNVHTIIFDEYLDEDGNELPNEVECIYRLYDTIARGRDDALKTTSMILISNCVDKASTFKNDLTIDTEARDDTKRLDRGKEKGWIYERIYNKAVTEEYNNSAVARAQKQGDRGRAYAGYAQGNKFKNNESFVQKKMPRGKGAYLYNLTYDGNVFSLKFYDKDGVIYMSDEDVNNDFGVNFALTREDHTMNTSLILGPEIKQKLDQLKVHFSAGNLRFNNLHTKKIFLEIYKVL